ncbi:UNVERIFIED_CONTAM: hypothetical protein PYX00_000922 [Menopon gallinae]|uniref:Mitochondrial ribosomal protein S17 n=1 Tax=Menopon gallinae TaxID=328185 RepID=A0AAW2IAX8_9NEOP
MAAKVMKTVSDKLLLGRCVPSLIEKSVRVDVPTLELNEHLLTYFTNYSTFYALDQHGKCKSGDMVLIRKLPGVIKNVVTHEVMEIVFPLGDVVDPVTGEKCVGVKSRYIIEKEKELLGKLDSAFDYKKAPARGWQEGKRDFTDKHVYRKYHEFNEDEEEYNDPYAV